LHSSSNDLPANKPTYTAAWIEKHKSNDWSISDKQANSQRWFREMHGVCPDMTIDRGLIPLE
jgi:hypothetical protein